MAKVFDKAYVTERVQKPQGDDKRVVQVLYVDGNASNRSSTEVADVRKAIR